MGRYSPLLKAVFVLVAFWWLVTLLVYMAMPPWALEAWLNVFGEGVAETVTPTNHLSVIKNEVVRMAHLVAEGAGWGLLAAGGIVSTIIFTEKAFFKGRAEAKPPWRAIKTTIGSLDVLPEMDYYKKVSLDPKVKLTKAQRNLLFQVMGYLESKPKAYVGDGHTSTLYEHTLNAIKRAVDKDPENGLLLLAAACHDIGKTVSWVKAKDENGSLAWKQVGYHAQDGGRLLAQFQGWWELPYVERTSLFLAVSYSHSAGDLPIKVSRFGPKEYEELVQLLSDLQDIDGSVTKAEKQRVIEGMDIPKLAVEVFLQALDELVFHEKGVRLSYDMVGSGWRLKDKIYLLERAVHSKCMELLDSDVGAALGGSFRATGALADFTKHLCEGLDKKGWLVLEAEKPTLPNEERGELVCVEKKNPLFRIEIIPPFNKNVQRFNGILIVQLPERMRERYYPRQELPGELAIRGAHKPVENQKDTAVSKKRNRKGNKGNKGETKVVLGDVGLLQKMVRKAEEEKEGKEETKANKAKYKKAGSEAPASKNGQNGSDKAPEKKRKKTRKPLNTYNNTINSEEQKKLLLSAIASTEKLDSKLAKLDVSSEDFSGIIKGAEEATKKITQEHQKAFNR